MPDTTSKDDELREKIDGLVNLLGYTDDVSGVASDLVQLINTHTNKAIGEVLDRLESEQETEDKAVNGETITYVPLSAIEAERKLLNDKEK